nr:hypothetical protein [Cressdnaviricota sp.]UOF82585.1 hypothetical protein [Cressdnaviricota sp.]
MSSQSRYSTRSYNNIITRSVINHLVNNIISIIYKKFITIVLIRYLCLCHLYHIFQVIKITEYFTSSGGFFATVLYTCNFIPTRFPMASSINLFH